MYSAKVKKSAIILLNVIVNRIKVFLKQNFYHAQNKQYYHIFMNLNKIYRLIFYNLCLLYE